MKETDTWLFKKVVTKMIIKDFERNLAFLNKIYRRVISCPFPCDHREKKINSKPFSLKLPFMY